MITIFVFSMMFEAALLVWIFNNLSRKAQVALAAVLLGMNGINVCCLQSLPKECIPVVVASVLFAMAGIIFGIIDLRKGTIAEKFTANRGLYLISFCIIAAGIAHLCIYPVNSVGVSLMLIGFGVFVTINAMKRIFLFSLKWKGRVLSKRESTAISKRF